MTSPFFVGWLAQGVSTGASFVENTVAGYARQPVTMAVLFNGVTALTAGVTFGATSSAYTVTQRALYDQATGGNLLQFWNLAAPVAVAAGSTDTLPAGGLMHFFPALNPMPAAETFFQAGAVMGTTMDGLPIIAGVAVAVTNAGALIAAGGGGGAGALQAGALPSAPATSVYVGTSAAGAAAASTLTALLDAAIGSAQGSILYRGAATWSVLAPGTAGQVLATGGAGANPSWVAQSGGGGSSTISPVTYTSPGAISVSDGYSLVAIAGTTSQAMTLAAGTNGVAHAISNYGPAPITVALNLYGSSQTLALPVGQTINVFYDTALNTYLYAT